MTWITLAVISGLALFVPLAAVAQTSEVSAVREKWIEAYNAGDAESLAELVTEDVVLMPPNHPALSGRADFRSFYENVFEQGSYQLEVASDETVDFDSWAFDRGTHTVTMTPRGSDEGQETPGKHVVLLRKEAGGSWKIARLIWNMDVPPQPAE